MQCGLLVKEEGMVTQTEEHIFQHTTISLFYAKNKTSFEVSNIERFHPLRIRLRRVEQTDKESVRVPSSGYLGNLDEHLLCTKLLHLKEI